MGSCQCTLLAGNGGFVRKVLKFDLGRVAMTVFEPITRKHFETRLPQNNVVSNAIKRDRIAITG